VALLAVVFLARFGADPALMGEIVGLLEKLSMFRATLRLAPRHKVAAEDTLRPVHLAISG
jgi:hypothetical protein